jgi:hypothetical protein
MAGSDKCDRPRRKWWRKLEICKIARRAVACYRALSGRLSGAALGGRCAERVVANPQGRCGSHARGSRRLTCPLHASVAADCTLRQFPRSV